jgi:drug/metabolite transporter (DMT)-like permease
MILASGFMLLAVPVGGLTPIHLNPGAVVALVILGAGSTGIAFALNYQLLESEGAVAASIVGYLLPVVSVLLGSIFLGERPDLRVIGGMVVVLAGVALTRLRSREQPRMTPLVIPDAVVPELAIPHPPQPSGAGIPAVPAPTSTQK